MYSVEGHSENKTTLYSSKQHHSFFYAEYHSNKAVEDFFPNMPQSVFTAIIRYIVITHYSLGSNYSGTQDSNNRLQELFGHSIYENIQVEQTQHVSPKEMGTLTKTACYFFQGTQWDFLQDFWGMVCWHTFILDAVQLCRVSSGEKIVTLNQCSKAWLQNAVPETNTRRLLGLCKWQQGSCTDSSVDECKKGKGRLAKPFWN